MDGVGGWNQSQSDGQIVITFPGYTPLYTASIDQCLNERKYLVPGLGDAGDRLFGTL